MSGLLMIVTDAGHAAIVNAENSGTAPVTIASVGVTATAFAASAATLAIPDEIKRITAVAGGAVAADTIHLMIEDNSADTYSLRGLGAYLADGTLFAVFSQADVLVEKSAQAALLLACDWQFADINAASLTFGDTSFLNPPATTETKGVVELATNAEALALTDALRALTPANLAAVLAALLATTDKAGLVELATNLEATTGTDTTRAITPANLAAVLGALLATTAKAGLVELATDAEATTGTDTARALTPANLTAVLAALSASTAKAGLVELATSAEAQALTDAVRAITPATLAAAFQGSNQSTASSGYQKLPGGLIFQWAVITTPGTLNKVFTYPIAFPNGLLADAVLPPDGHLISGQGATATQRTFTCRKASDQTTSNSGATFPWISIGR